MTIVICYKMDFKVKMDLKSVRRDKHEIMIRSILQKNIRIINIYAPNSRPRKYMKQLLTKLKGEIVVKSRH